MSTRMPAIFIGHGSPLNAIEDNPFSQAWKEIAQALPKPEAILCISAHWETMGFFVTGMAKPKTIHDFGGFPPALYKMEYPAPGSADLAWMVCEKIGLSEVQPDMSWGLDHGAWSVLCRMYPEANIPVVQLSLSRHKNAAYHYHLGHSLQELRDEGILILGSGNVVHNQRLVSWNAAPYDWATEFDGKVKQWILENNHEPLIHHEQQGRPAMLAINSTEHYLPLLYILGLKQEEEPVTFYAEQFVAGSISMRCVKIG